jgi:dTDP-glucose 4,6-dehydratase
MSERLLVIGSNSFSGSHFVLGALKDGAEVVGVSRSREPDQVFLPYLWSDHAGSFKFYELDVNHDLDEILGLVREFQPEYVVNFAAQGMVAQSWEHPTQWFQTNVVAMVDLHNRLRQCRFLKKYVHVSTPEVYGSTDGWVKEDHSFDPSTPYAVSRASCDMSLKSFWQAYQFPVVSTRSANVYGPGQQLYRVIPRAMLSGRLGETMPLHGGGTSVRSFIYIDDVVDATLRVMRHGSGGATYHISTERTVSVRDLVHEICDLQGLRVTDLVQETEERLGKDQSYLLSTKKIRDELGWSDTVSLESGLSRTQDWIDTNLSILRDHPMEYVHKE